MSLEVKANQFLYNIIELTHRKKYSRVIRICDFLESQGISSHEFIIVKSYAIAHTKGFAEALKYLQPFEGLLINAARIQYQQMQDMFAESESFFEALTTIDDGSVLDQLRQNNKILAGSSQKHIQQVIREDSKICQFIINKKQEEIVNKINTISSAYQQKKKQFHQEAISKKEMTDFCNQFIQSYQEISSTYRVKGRIKDLIQHYIEYLTSFIQSNL